MSKENGFLKLYISTHIDSSNIGNIDVYGMSKENGLWQQYFLFFLELYISVFIMDEIQKLLGAINEKKAENIEFEKKKHNLEKHVAEQEERIMKKINILKRHYEEEKLHGRKLEEDISSLQRKREKLDKQEEILDRVCKE